ncbi:carbohydrate ABC transporter permease [Nonomuraea antimicrobica]|uniref:Carbohydrate ABC transporter permease n=1 Tax=Nonomuraea antimicrobica TaxID=561173 RepID=A0ABP7DBM8_9ACTN
MRTIRTGWNQLLVTLAVAPFVIPLAVMVGRSVGGEGFLRNYGAVLNRPEMLTFLRNSVVIAAGTVAVTFVCTMLASYALAKLPLRGREVAFYLIVAALTLPSAALTVPLFINVRNLGLYDTPWAVILPIAALQTAFGVFLARGFMAGIPDETIDAARVDGANSFRVFWYIVLPLSRPVAAVVIVWTFVSAWNEYLLPLLFLQEVDQQTVTLLPSYFVGQFQADQPKVFAATVLIALPTVICYIAFSRFFERGIMAGSIK